MVARIARHPVIVPLLSLLLWGGAACRTFIDLPENQKGGVFNPVRCDMPAGQEAYLGLLRDEDGRPATYEYHDAVLGPNGRILDRFLVRNPGYRSSERGPLQGLLDLIRVDPEMPRWLRVYMDIYHPGVFDTEPIRGFRMLSDPPPNRSGGADGDQSATQKDDSQKSASQQGASSGKKE